jgi:nucleoid-associated protein YgaU
MLYNVLTFCVYTTLCQKISRAKEKEPMDLKFTLGTLRRRTFYLIVLVTLTAAMMPAAAFANGYGHQGRGWDPGPRQHRGQHRPKQDDDHDRQHFNKQHNNRHDDRFNRCDATYKVRRGDSLSEIAKHFGVSVNKLANANGIKNVNRIFAGQTLCIP